MARIAFGLTISIGGAGLWLALDEFRYLAPYGDGLLATRGFAIVSCVLALAFDLFAFLYWICRRLGLGDRRPQAAAPSRAEVRRGATFDSALAQRLREQREGRA